MEVLDEVDPLEQYPVGWDYKVVRLDLGLDTVGGCVVVHLELVVNVWEEVVLDSFPVVGYEEF